MELRAISSSSSGNCYLLRSETTGEVLAIEAGVKFDKVKQAVGFDLSPIVGCIVSHEHGDHAKAVFDFMSCFIPCYMSEGTADALPCLPQQHIELRILKPMQRVRIGSFEVMPFPVQHDAREPFGYLIRHEECGTVVFATDTYYLKYKFQGVSNWLIECNYRADILQKNFEKGLIDPKRRDRTLKSHMSYETCLQTLMANDLSRTNNIVLIHLSSDNSNEREFVSGLREATGKNVVAARSGLVMEFDKTPY